MPLYDFSCTECGYEKEEFDYMVSRRLRKCPSCQNKTLLRLIGAGSGIVFKSGYKDRSGESVWFPKDGSAYFDTGLRKTFNSAREKAEFMKANNIVQSGDLDMNIKKEKKQHHEKTNDTKSKKESK